MISSWSLAVRFATSLVVTTTSPPDSTIAFVNVTVIPMDRERVLTNQTVLVQGGKIAAIGPAATVTLPPTTTRIDGQGKFLIPGLADMHAHCSCSDGDGPRLAAAYLAAGVTTIRIMHGGPADVALRNQVRTGEMLGPTIYTAGPQIQSIGSPAEAVRIVEEYKTGGYDFIKVRNPEITPEILDSFVAAAHRAKLPFGGHVPGGEVKLARWLEAGPVSIEHLDGYWGYLLKRPPGMKGLDLYFDSLMTLVENGVLVPSDSGLAAIVAQTKRAGVWNVPTQVVYSTLNFGMSDTKHGEFVKLRSRIIKALHDAGAGLLAGTDAVVTPGVAPGSSLPTELQLLVDAGLTPYEALEAATRNAAIFFGTLDQGGTIEAGKRADLALLDGNPLQSVGNTVRPVGVMVGGRWLARAELDARLAALGGP